MTTTIRLSVAAAVAAVALTIASAASAAYAPRMIVSGTNHALGSGGPVTFDISQAEADDPTAVITLHSPLGFTADLSATPGSTIGAVSATVKVGALGGAKVPVTGVVKAADPNSFLNNPCTRQATPHGAVWTLDITLAGTPVQVPLYVDLITAGPETAFASAKIRVCFNSPTDPPRNPTGSQLLAAKFSVNVFTNPSTAGAYRWIGVFTPYVPGTATPNIAGTVQSQTVQRLGVQLNLTLEKVKKRVGGKLRSFARLTGSLLAAEQGVTRHPVQIMRSTRSARQACCTAFRTLRTNARGRFSLDVLITRRTWFRAKTTIPARTLPANCGAAAPPVPCSNVWTAPVGTKAKPLFNRTTFAVRP